MRYTLRQLEVFLATAHHQNLSRAAEQLAMSQSAASSALMDLERQFDIQLFDRAGKRLQLNELGRAIRPQAQALLEQAQALQHSLARHGSAGDLTVGATLTIGNYMAVGIMAQYMNDHPGTRVRLQVGNTRDIARQVANFELDVGLIEGELMDPELQVIPWRDDELVAFCAPDHPLARQPVLDDDAIRAATWIVRESGSGTRQTFERAMHDLLHDLHILLELQHTEAIKRAVEAGLGIGCLSRVTLQEAFRRGSLVPLQIPQRDLARRFYFILQRHKYVSTGIEHWLALCQRAP